MNAVLNFVEIEIDRKRKWADLSRSAPSVENISPYSPLISLPTKVEIAVIGVEYLAECVGTIGVSGDQRILVARIIYCR